MAHAKIIPKNEDHYYAGSYIAIPYNVTDEHADTAIDLTGMTATWRLKESLTDTDADALITKTGTEGGAGGEIEFDADPTTGTCKVIIDSANSGDAATGDTEDIVVDENGNRVESKVFEWHFRVEDSNGREVTTDTGTWEIYNS